MALMNRLRFFRRAAPVFVAGFLAAGCATEKPKDYSITVTREHSGPRITYPETGGKGRAAKVVFQGMFPDTEQEALLSLIRAQGWKVSSTTTIGNSPFLIRQTPVQPEALQEQQPAEEPAAPTEENTNTPTDDTQEPPQQ